jgi:glycogen debranching enzyme
MQEILRLDEPFSIAAGARRSDAPPRVLKHGESFGVFDQHGDIVRSDQGEQGLYHEGTRFLSQLELRLGPLRPLLLSSTISDDNAVFTADFTNPDIRQDGLPWLPHGQIHVFRSRVLRNGSCLERIRVSNFTRQRLEFPLVILFDADFVDVFEVRGVRRSRRGDVLPTDCGEDCTLSYRGLDGTTRRTRLRWSHRPDRLEPRSATFRLSLDSHAALDLDIAVEFEIDGRQLDPAAYDKAVQAVRSEFASRAAEACQLRSSSELLNAWINRSTADLQMMMTQTPHGLYPYAGIPWFSAPFGRDGIITAFELLWADPSVARGVLSFLASTQATSRDDARDAQPGRIFHEMRSGEMAALGEIPFGQYYGSADATPLFVMLAHAYYVRTGDRTFIERLWPHILAALEWMDSEADPDGDGFIEYSRQSETGLVHQGWKDSHDAVFHEDGRLAGAPIALSEVQGYAYAAWKGAAALATARDDAVAARLWEARAERLRDRFEEAFWCEDLGTYALALDGEKRPCRVRTSNAGHCLFTGIAADDRARRVCSSLMDESSFAGWGVRTVAAGEARYNPMSYHNGSIWPHDNAMIAAGFARYGMTTAATRLTDALFDLSQVVDLHRLPELICGFHRRAGQSPTLYPVACAPQAWAAGAVHLLLGACLGLQIDAAARRVSFVRALLPERIEWLRLTNLQVGDGRVDLLLEQHPHDVGITVLKRDEEIEVLSVK